MSLEQERNEFVANTLRVCHEAHVESQATVYLRNRECLVKKIFDLSERTTTILDQNGFVKEAIEDAA